MYKTRTAQEMDSLKCQMDIAYEKFVAKRDKALSKTYSPGNGMCESEYKAVMNAGLEYARLRQQVMQK